MVWPHSCVAALPHLHTVVIIIFSQIGLRKHTVKMQTAGRHILRNVHIPTYLHTLHSAHCCCSTEPSVLLSPFIATIIARHRGVCAALWDLIKTLLRFCRFARVVRPAAREIPLLIQEKLNKRTRDLAVLER